MKLSKEDIRRAILEALSEGELHHHALRATVRSILSQKVGIETMWIDNPDFPEFEETINELIAENLIDHEYVLRPPVLFSYYKLTKKEEN